MIWSYNIKVGKLPGGGPAWHTGLRNLKVAPRDVYHDLVYFRDVNVSNLFNRSPGMNADILFQSYLAGEAASLIEVDL